MSHWHGFEIPAEIDGTEEEGSLAVQPGTHLRYGITPTAPGSRYVHSHAMAMDNLSLGIYSGQFSFVYVEPKHNPGRYDQEIFLSTHEWEPYYVEGDDDEDPLMEEYLGEKDWAPSFAELAYRIRSINGKALGHGEPIRVKEGQKDFIPHFERQCDGEHPALFAGPRIRRRRARWESRAASDSRRATRTRSRRARRCVRRNEESRCMDSRFARQRCPRQRPGHLSRVRRKEGTSRPPPAVGYSMELPPLRRESPKPAAFRDDPHGDRPHSGQRNGALDDQRQQLRSARRSNSLKREALPPCPKKPNSRRPPSASSPQYLRADQHRWKPDPQG